MINRPVAVLIAVLAGGSFAQQPLPELAPFPLELARTPSDSSKKDKEDLQKMLPMMLRASDVAVPDSAKLSSAIANLRRQDCNRDDNCLSQLAKLAGSLYGFFAQIDYDLDGNVVVSGRVVRDDGKAMGLSKTIKKPKGKAAFNDIARAAIGELLVALDVAHLSPFRPKEEVAEVKPPEAVKPLEPMNPTEKVVVTQAFRFPGQMAAGVGAVLVLGGGIVFTGSGNVRTDANRNVYREDADRVGAVRTGQTVGVAMIAIGAVVGAVGVGAWLFGPEETTTTIVPVPGGAAVMLQGNLP